MNTSSHGMAATVAAAAANLIPPCTARQSCAALLTNTPQLSLPCGVLHGVAPQETESAWRIPSQLGQQEAELRRLLEEACRHALCQTKAVLQSMRPLRQLPCDLANEAVHPQQH